MAKNQSKNQGQSLEDLLGGSNSFLVKNKKYFGYGALAVVAIIVSIICYIQFYSKPREAKANEAIAPCQELFMQAMGMQQQINMYPEPADSDTTVQAKQYKAMKSEIATKWTQALNGDGAKTIGFAKIISTYSGTDAANVANAYAAACCYNMGNMDQALKYAEDYDGGDDTSVSPMVKYFIAELYVNKGELDKGAEMILSAATKLNDQTLAPFFYFQAGKHYYDAKKYDKAKGCFNTCNTYKTSPLSAQAENYLNAINQAQR